MTTRERRRLASRPYLDLRPRWSPDGSRILFTTTRDGSFDLWAFDVAGGFAEAVVADGAHNMDVDWIGEAGEVELSTESSGWIAARVLGSTQHGAMDSYLFAHPNPVFVVVDHEPTRSIEDARFFVGWIDETIEDLDGMDRWDDPAHKAEALETFETARRLYQAQGEGDR